MSRSRSMAVRVLSHRDLRRVLGAFLAFSAAQSATWIAILLYAYEATGPASVGVTVEPGKVVIREGDVGDRSFVLASGAVRVEREGRHVRELATPGGGFGEIALLRDVPRTATVTATAESVLLAIDRASFLAAVTGNPSGQRARGHGGCRGDDVTDTARMTETVLPVLPLLDAAPR